MHQPSLLELIVLLSSREQQERQSQRFISFYLTFTHTHTHTHTRRKLYTATSESRQTGHDLTIATAYIVSTWMPGEDGLTLTSYLSSRENSILPNLVLQHSSWADGLTAQLSRNILGQAQTHDHNFFGLELQQLLIGLVQRHLLLDGRTEHQTSTTECNFVISVLSIIRKS